MQGPAREATPRAQSSSPKDPRVHMDPALAATNAHTTYVETKPVMVAISLFSRLADTRLLAVSS